MMNFKKLLTGPRAINRKLVLLLAVLCLVGFIDAAYVSIKQIQGGPLPCAIVTGCDTVITSQYSKIFGIPVALFGAVFYLINIILLVEHFNTGRAHFIGYLTKTALVGFLATLWFLYLQIFVIAALCLYCLVSAAVSLILFASIHGSHRI